MINSRAVILKIRQNTFILNNSFLWKMKGSNLHQNVHTFCHILSCQEYCKGKNFSLYTQTLNFAKVLEPEELSPMVTISEMKRYLKNFSILFEEGYTCLHLSCPFCLHVHGNMKDKCGTLYINKTTGMHICYSCCQLGSWQAFQDFINIKQITKNQNKSQITLPYPTNFGIEIKGQCDEAKHLYEEALPFNDLDQKEFENILEKFKIMRLTLQHLTKYNVRISNDRNSLLLPLQRWDKNIAAIKFLTYQSDENGEKLMENLFPRQSKIALFGFSQVARNQQEIVLTSTPLDAIAVNQETNIPAVTLPYGIATLPQEILPLLERYRKITIWFDNNMQEWEVAKMFSRKLGTKRCYFVRPKGEHPRPLIGLQKKFNLLRILKESKPISHQAITTFESLRQDIFEELKHSEQVSGVKWKRYTGLNKLLKGHRRGELTIFTGPTGSGKTTYMSEYSLDLCMQGVSTLWGSFEISNIRLGKMMLIQFSLCPLTKNLEKYDFWADKFQQLPMFFMTFRGQEAIKNVIDAMSHAVYVHDIQHVIVDNLQFMMGSDEANSKVDRFWKQDLIVAAFRKFSTQHNCHVTLVMHPRKEREEEELNTSSIYGGVKASQEADNILILQNKSTKLQKGKHIQVTKNRFDGDKGIIPLTFDKETLSFSKKKVKKMPAEENFKYSNLVDVTQENTLKQNSR